MHRRWIVWIAGVVSLVMLAAGFCYASPQQVEVKLGNGLFSWRGEALDRTERQALFARMKQCELTDLYQQIPADTPKETVQEFLQAAYVEGIAVYLLTGAPEWGMDANGEDMQREVARAAGYNQGLAEAARLRGVMMDVEPYQTRAWHGDADGVMAAYVRVMSRAKTACERQSMVYIACIPYFYDNKGQSARLEQLIQEGCHAVAVMNYHKGDEAVHLETEAALAKAAGKPLVTIYELQPPGSHGLTERNTYHREGLTAVEKNWQGLREQVDHPQFSYALHCDQALQEVLSRE